MGGFALIGDPVAGSPSPAMFAAAFQTAGLGHTYEALRVAREELPGAWPDLHARYLGMNVTTPLKEAIVPLLDGLSAEAEAAGSVNTVVVNALRAEGHTTDGAGFLAAIERALGSVPPVALVVGGGGAARAVIAALRDRGTTVGVTARDARTAARMAGALDAQAILPEAAAAFLANADLLVHATPARERGEFPLLDALPLHPRLTVFDLVYRPRRTALLLRSEAAGCRTIEGVEMLVEQAARSFALWTGQQADTNAMSSAALTILEI